ncbi:gap protein [Mycobacteroides abscessus subsp. abscessus]|nr:gap protein [Mycobacteroides abscessus subsp. abscessus]
MSFASKRGRVRDMWRELLGLAFLMSLNPVLLGLILVVISRPRPVQNLLAFWVGALVVNVPSFVIALFALHMVPSFASFAKNLATADPGSSIKPLQLGTGVLCVVIAVWIAARLRSRQRENQPVATGASGDSSVLVLDSEAPAVEARPVGRIRGAVSYLGSTFQRLLHRGKGAWENGALWVALVLGIGYMPPPPLVLLVDTIIVGSGTAMSTQVIAAVVFVFTMLAVFEIALISYVIAPARTQAVLEPIHNWALSHRQLVLLVLFAVVGIWQVLTGVGLV